MNFSPRFGQGMDCPCVSVHLVPLHLVLKHGGSQGHGLKMLKPYFHILFTFFIYHFFFQFQVPKRKNGSISSGSAENLNEFGFPMDIFCWGSP